MDERGHKMGVRFGPQPLMSNSREALEAGEFAKEQDRYDAYHEAVFQAFFTDCLDIGRRAVLMDVARRVGLDTNALNSALESGIYFTHLQETSIKAKAEGISSAPTFIIDGYGIISGAQPIDTFRAALCEVQSKAPSAVFK